MKSKVFKRLLSISLCLIMVFGTLSIGGVIDFKAFAASGSCGTNVTWELNSDTGELLISGTGAMNDYTTSSTAPWYYNYKGKITKVTIEDSVTSIGESAFEDCTGLTSITIPDSVTSIGNWAFDGCTGLTSITIPNSVTSIRQYAFYKCTGLTSITIPNSVTSIGESAFDGCTSLTNIIINSNVLKTIGIEAFRSCTSLKSIKIPDSVTSICNGAFSGCTGLKTVYYTGDIGKWCAIDFYNSYSNPTYYASELYINGSKVEGKLKIPDGVTSIGDYAFYHCTTLTGITIPDSVTSIGSSAFSGCTGLTSITIPDSVTSIGSAFSGCTGLTSITIPDSVTSIGDDAFWNCTGLTSVTIPDSVTSIDDSAFRGCTGLKTVYYTGTPTQWRKISIGSDNSYLTSATRIYKSNTSRAYYAEGSCGENVNYILYATGELVINGTGEMTDYTSSSKAPWDSLKDKITKVTIKDGVTSVGSYAFKSCLRLTEISLPNSILSINESSLEGCTKLTDIALPNSVLNINESAFEGCTGFTDIALPDSVEKISSYAFRECTGLTDITIGKGIKTIGEDAFYGCSSLANVNYLGCEDLWNKIEISEYNSELTNAKKTYADHIWNNGVCELCGKTNGCKHDKTETRNAKTATCTLEGFTGDTYCTLCNTKISSGTSIKALGHSFTTYTYNNDATTEKDGTETATCDRCTATDTRTKSGSKLQPAHTHSYTKKVTAPTCTEQGYTTYTCSCGFSYNDDYQPATNHADSNNDGYCDNCSAPMKSNPVNPNANAKINVAGGRSVDYRSKVIIKAKASGVDSKYKLAIYVGNNRVATGSNTEVTYNAGETKGDINYTVKVVDANGNIAKDANGNEISKDGGKISCNSGFFKKLVAFFKGLFGSLPNVTVQP